MMAINKDNIWKLKSGEIVIANPDCDRRIYAPGTLGRIIVRLVSETALPFYYVYFKYLHPEFRLVSADEIEANFSSRLSSVGLFN